MYSTGNCLIWLATSKGNIEKSSITQRHDKGTIFTKHWLRELYVIPTIFNDDRNLNDNKFIMNLPVIGLDDICLLYCIWFQLLQYKDLQQPSDLMDKNLLTAETPVLWAGRLSSLVFAVLWDKNVSEQRPFKFWGLWPKVVKALSVHSRDQFTVQSLQQCSWLSKELHPS